MVASWSTPPPWSYPGATLRLPCSFLEYSTTLELPWSADGMCVRNGLGLWWP